MIITYQRENDCNYMIPESEKEISEALYAPLRILEETPSNLFLQPSRQFLNGQIRILYDISSRQSLLRLYEHSPIPGNVLYNILDSLSLAMQECGRYLMDSSDLLLEPETIYISPSSGKVRFCCLPGSGEDIAENRFMPLADFILKHLDHGDPSAVGLGYRFFDLAGSANFSFPAQWPLMREHFSNAASPDTERPQERFSGAEREKNPFSGNHDTGAAGGQPGFRAVSPGQAPGMQSLPGKMNSGESFLNESPADGSENANKKTRIKWLVMAIPVCSSVLIYILFLYFLRLDLLQAGGLFFLLLATDALIITSIRRKRGAGEEGSKTGIRSDKTPDLFDEEEDFFRILMTEAEGPRANGPDTAGRKQAFTPYSPSGNRMPEQTGRKEFIRINTAGPKISADPYDEGTRFIDDTFGVMQVRLVSLNIRRCPDLIPATNPSLIGKSPKEADLIINHDVISRIHARIEVLEKTGEVFLTDMNSTNGTFVDGTRLLPNERRLIKDGQKISFASIHFQLKIRLPHA